MDVIALDEFATSGLGPTWGERMGRSVTQALSLVLLAVVGVGSGCPQPSLTGPTSDPPRGEPWFLDATEQLGVKFLHDPGPTGTYFMPQQVGSGAALFDFDNDRRLDLYLLQNAGPGSKVTNRLFHQTSGGRFEDVSADSGLDIDGHNMGVAVGDANNDGHPDVLVTQYGGVKLFVNQGHGKFKDVTAASGLANPGWGSSAAFFDYDRDGWLDLIVVNYVDYDPTWPCSGPDGKQDYCAPKTFRGRVSRLFHNLGVCADDRSPRFEDKTEASGFGRYPGPGLGVVCADFDGDRWPDVFIANDGAANHLWMNQHDGTFKEEAVQRGVAYNGMGRAEAGMGIALGDVDGDGLLDLFVTHLGDETNTLWYQGPRGLFQDRTASTGLTAGAWRGTGFGTLLSDFDLDGALDLAVVNGRVSANPKVQDWSLGPFWSRYGERNQIFSGDGRGKFRDLSRDNDPFCGVMNVARGLARGDLDDDGDDDLVVTSISGPTRIYRNVAPRRGHWLRVRALLPALNRDALGTEVRVKAGGRTWVASLHPAESYVCNSEPSVCFGLGEASTVDGIDVTWPDGDRERFAGGPADRRIELRKGEGQAIAE